MPSPANSISTAAGSSAFSTKQPDSVDEPWAQSQHVTAGEISSAPYPLFSAAVISSASIGHVTQISLICRAYSAHGRSETPSCADKRVRVAAQFRGAPNANWAVRPLA